MAVDFQRGFVVFDLETTGLSAQRNKIIEIAAIKVLDIEAREHASFEHLVRIRERVPGRIAEMTGITDQMLSTGVTLTEAILAFEAFCEDLPLVAYNAGFDKRFLLSAAQETGWQVNNEFHCALRMARRAFPGHASYRLSAIARQMGLDVTSAHRAKADCVMTVQVYVAALKRLGQAIAV